MRKPLAVLAVLAATVPGVASARPLATPWHSAAWAGMAVKHDADPGQLTAIECTGAGRHHGSLYRRFDCYAAGPSLDGGCVYHFRIRVVTPEPHLQYRAYHEVCL